MMKKILTALLTTFFTLSLAINGISSSSSNKWKQQQNRGVNNFFVLGDSLSDMGNLCMIIKEITGNIDKFLQNQPYANIIANYKTEIEQLKNFSLPKDYHESRFFSNGPVAANIFAEKLGTKLTSGYKIDYEFNSPLSTKITVDRKGTNYAIAGAKSIYSQELLDKLADFSLPVSYQNGDKNLNLKEWIAQIAEGLFSGLSSIKKQAIALLEHHKINSKDLFFVEIGGNDVFDLYEKIQPNLYKQNTDFTFLIEESNDVSIANLKETLQLLIKNGAKKIMLANCVNVVNTPFMNTSNERIKNISEKITNSFNSKWSNMFDEFENNHPSVFKKVDFHGICAELLKKFDQKGFNTTDPIVNYNVDRFSEIIFGETRTPIINAKTKEEKDKYFFFDLIHPSAKIHQLLAEQLYKIYETWKKTK